MPHVTTFDIPAGVGKTRFYRELDRIAVELHFAKVGGSVYLFTGDDSAIRAHTLADIAARFGAGPVGETDGPQVMRIADEAPAEYFTVRDLAKQVADELLVDHRVRGNKKKSRSIPTIVARLRGQHDMFEPGGEWLDLSQFLTGVGVRDMQARHAEFERMIDREEAAQAISAVVLDETELPW